MTAKKNRKLHKAKKLVTDVVADKAASLNPLTPRVPEEPVVPENVPRITDESIAEHREDVLSGARKYIYPLAHSKHRIIVITSGIIIATLVGFLVYCGLGLYKLYQYNSFLYRVTQVVPFPVARVNGHFVDYENYLFELRHYVHYYERQIQRNFNGSDRQQLLQFRKQALDDTINAAYTKQLAQQNGVNVSDREVDARIQTARDQNRLGADNKEFADVIKTYLGWSVPDFKRTFKQVILAEKVVAKLDVAATQRASAVLAKLKAGANFSKLAQKYSQDERSQHSGGNYGFAITKSNANVSPQVVDALFKLRPGKFSGVIVAGPVLPGGSPSLEIVRLVRHQGSSVTAQHITIHLKDISAFIAPLRAKEPPKTYVHF